MTYVTVVTGANAKPPMARYLVKLVSARRSSYQHLVGRVAIAYPESKVLAALLRLPAPDPLLAGSRYVDAREVVFEPIRPTTFDDFTVEA